MRFFSPFQDGLRRALRHRGLVLLLWLGSLVPALLVLSLMAGDLGGGLDRSLFADRLLAGDSMAPWIDFLASDANDLGSIQGALPGRFLLGVLLQILLAAGAVEVLLERTARGEHPLLLGVGRHGWRFFRSALIFALLLAVGAGLLRALNLAFGGGDDRLQLIGWGVVAGVGFLLYAVLDLAYDLSRIAAAAHGEGRMTVGLLKALGFVFRHAGVLLPLWGIFVLVLLGLHAGYLAARASWVVSGAGGVVLLVAAQQVVFLLGAFLRTSLWGAEIAYYQGVGEPRFCGGLTRRQRRRQRREKRREEGRRRRVEEPGRRPQEPAAGASGAHPP